MPQPAWPADKVERRPLESLTAYARNARTHSDEQISKIAASMKEWGWTNPVLVDEEGGIIAGHGRVLAAKRLGIGEAPVMVATGWSDAQRRAYVIADNQLAISGSGWDNDLLKIELADLQAGDFDLSLTGFDISEVNSLLSVETVYETDPDDVPEVQAEVVSRPGDLWILGNHRVICGDSTDADTIAKLMDGERADLLFTSPPYAQQRDYGAAKEKVQAWDALMQGVFSAAPVKDGAQILVNLGLVHKDGEWIPYWDAWIEWMRAQGWRRFGWYVWDQGFGLPGDWNGRLAPSHEFIFHFNRVTLRSNKTKAKNPDSIGVLSRSHTMRSKDGTLKEFSSPKSGANTHKIPDSVIRIMRHQGSLGKAGKHPAVFPVALVEEALGAYSKEGDVVFEPFCGSGTQVIAADKMSRHCFAIDIDPAYVDVAVRRWQLLTGNDATLEETGETFAEVMARRHPDQQAKVTAAASA
jgi:DNA modification methylase